MTLTKRFLHKESNLLEISRIKRVVGVFVGLCYSFVFYCFLYLLREIARVFSVNENYDLWIFTEDEVQFYNLFFAFVAVILGQSIVFVFWFDRPKRFFGKLNHRKTSLVNDQRVLTWFFLSWFIKLSLLYGLFFGMFFNGGFHEFSFYPDYKFLFVLIVIVLFFQTWNSIRITFKRISIKWMMYSFVSVSIVALGLSKVNVIDYKALNHKFLQYNIYYNYKLELPESIATEYVKDKISWVQKIYIVQSKNAEINADPIIVINNEPISLEKLPETVQKWYNSYDKNYWYFLTCKLYIHKSISMSFVNKLENVLTALGIVNIDYATVPKNIENNRWQNLDFSIKISLPNWKEDSLRSNAIFNLLINVENKIEIERIATGYLVNDFFIKENHLDRVIKKLIVQNPDYAVKFNFKDHTIFSDYIYVLSMTKKAINEIREEYSEKKYATNFSRLDKFEREEVRNKFPFLIFEISKELKQKVEHHTK